MHMFDVHAIINPSKVWTKEWQLPTAGRLVRCVSLSAVPASAVKVFKLQHANVNGIWPEDEKDFTQVFTGQKMVCPVLAPVNTFVLGLVNKLTSQSIELLARLEFDISGKAHPLDSDGFVMDPPGMFENDYRVHAEMNEEACGNEYCLVHIGHKSSVVTSV